MKTLQVKGVPVILQEGMKSEDEALDVGSALDVFRWLGVVLCCVAKARARSACHCLQNEGMILVKH